MGFFSKRRKNREYSKHSTTTPEKATNISAETTSEDDEILDPLPGVMLEVLENNSMDSSIGDKYDPNPDDLESLLKILENEPAPDWSLNAVATLPTMSSNESLVTLPTKNAPKQKTPLLTSYIYLSMLSSGEKSGHLTTPREIVLASLQAHLSILQETEEPPPRLSVSEIEVRERPSRRGVPVSVDGSFSSLLNEDLAQVDQVVQAALDHLDYTRACELYETLRRDVMLTTPQSHVVRPLLSRLAITCLLAGFEKKANVYCRQLIEWSDTTPSEMAEALILRGFLCFGFNELEVALTSWREAAYKINSDSSHAALLWNNLACLQVQMGSSEEARQSLHQSMALQEESQTTDPTDVMQSMLDVATVKSNFAVLSELQRDYETAADRLQESLLIQESILPDDIETVQNTRANLERMLQLDECTPLEERLPRCPSSVEWKQPLFGGSIPLPRATTDVGGTADLIQLGPLMMEFTPLQRIQASCAEAFALIKESNDAVSSSSSSSSSPKRSSLPVDVDSTQIMNAETKLSGVYQDVTDHLVRNEVKDALDLLKSCLRNHRDKYGTMHPLVASTLHNIGIVLLFSDRYDDALRYFQQATSIRISTLGINHADACASMMKVGMIQVSRRDFDNALVTFTQVLHSRRKALGYNHPQIVMALNNIACVHLQCGGLVTANKALEEALEVLTPAENSRALLATSILLSNQGFVLSLRGLYDESTAAYLEASEIQKSLYPADHPTLAMTIENLGFVVAKCRQNEMPETTCTLNLMQCGSFYQYARFAN